MANQEQEIKVVGTGLTAGEVKTLYESNPNTNEFDDAEQTNLSNQSNTNTGDNVTATESVEGIVEIATQTETNTGTDDARALTPLKLKNAAGVTGFFLEAKGAFGTGAGWADSGFIDLMPVLLYASNATERGIYPFFAGLNIKLDAIDPVILFDIYSTSAPAGGTEDVRWQLTTKYIADSESPGKAADEVLFQTQTLSNFTANTKQSILAFSLDRTLIAGGDTMHMNLERLGGDVLDTYNADLGIGLSGIRVQTTIFNP